MIKKSINFIKTLISFKTKCGASKELFELIVAKFATEREKYNYYINNLEEVDALLLQGAAKASAVATGVLNRVRTKLGY